METFVTSDLDQVRLAIAGPFYDTFIDPLGRPRAFEARIDSAQLGDLTVGDLSIGTDVRMRVGELGSYHVNVPLSGRFVWHQRGRAEAVATARHAAVFAPAGDTGVDRWTGDCRLLAVKIEQAALHAQLERLLGRELPGRVDFAPQLDISRGTGLGWARLLRWAVGEAREAGGMVTQPLLAAPLQETLLGGLLLAADHPYREELAAPAEALRPAPVKRVLDAVHAHPEQPHTASSLAAVAGVGVRRLQEGFREHVGMSPTVYLRGVRLDRVNEELKRGAEERRGEGAPTVGEVAYRWGFAHLGRFAAVYRARFGETPSQTLRGSERLRPGGQFTARSGQRARDADRRAERTVLG
ncbi:AraC family transcriptional regulator [Streptomyces sp. NPDC021093]|uniref:AraC family transcriptional regulator n=1 Tax=Streptomyces sp. NPDC021093 TaxID=3365112 RepID=UPI0037B65EE7